MYVWAVLLAGPLVLPFAFVVRPDLPPTAGDALLVLGVLALFLAICATEAVGSGASRRGSTGAE